MSKSDRITRVALAHDVCTRILKLAGDGGDAIAVLDGFLSRLELGFERYGALDLAANKRDWDKESDEELADWIAYRALKRTSERLKKPAVNFAFDMYDVEGGEG